MCAKQHESVTLQQFLYRMIGLKQKIRFSLKQPDSVKYDMSAIQWIFLNFICQGIAQKNDSVRRDLKTLLCDPTVTDETLLRQIIKTTMEKNEQKRRLGRSSASKVSNAHTTNAGSKERTTDNVKRWLDHDVTIQKLNAPVEVLTQAMENLKAMTALIPVSNSRDSKPQPDRKPPREKKGCQECVSQSKPDCNHCSICRGEEHCAVGCSKGNKPWGNGKRSGQRDHPWLTKRSSPTQKRSSKPDRKHRLIMTVYKRLRQRHPTWFRSSSF